MLKPKQPHPNALQTPLSLFCALHGGGECLHISPFTFHAHIHTLAHTYTHTQQANTQRFVYQLRVKIKRKNLHETERERGSFSFTFCWLAYPVESFEFCLQFITCFMFMHVNAKNYLQGMPGSRARERSYLAAHFSLGFHFFKKFWSAFF